MTILKIDGCGVGLNSDLTPEELGAGVWSATENMRFRNGYAERFRGTTAVFTTPLVTPYFIAPYATTTTKFVVYAGLAAVYADDGTTQTDITGTAPTGAIDDKWTGGTLNGVFVLNNGVDNPMYWNGDTATNLATLTGWTGTWKASALRPFKNCLVERNWVENDTECANNIGIFGGGGGPHTITGNNISGMFSGIQGGGTVNSPVTSRLNHVVRKAQLAGSTGITCAYGLTEANLIVNYETPVGSASVGSGNTIVNT